jgi:hypothetical protein
MDGGAGSTTGQLETSTPNNRFLVIDNPDSDME